MAAPKRREAFVEAAFQRMELRMGPEVPLADQAGLVALLPQGIGQRVRAAA
jgi:hypothetical protein